MATNMAAPTAFTAPTALSAPDRTRTSEVAHDRRRVWLWTFLAVVGASQLYFVRELFAALALFAIAFAAIAAVVAGLYMLQKFWELAVARLASLRRPIMTIAGVTNIRGVSRENRKAA